MSENKAEADTTADKGGTPTSALQCLRCRNGPSYHGGHRREDPDCVLHGCSSWDPTDIQAYIKRQSIEKVVQDALRHGTVATSTPTRSTPINTGTKPPRSQPPLLSLLAKGKQSCQACASADNCILFGFDNPSPAKTKQLMLEQEIGRAEATRSMAASSSITPPLPPSR